LALSITSLAAEVNSAAVKAMGRLSTLGDIAREDDEIHASLVFFSSPQTHTAVRSRVGLAGRHALSPLWSSGARDAAVR
jgi:hypothetical protein